MKTFVTQCIFKLLVALNLFGVTLQLKWPMVAAIGNGKRSQPRSGVYNPKVIDRQWAYDRLNNGRRISQQQDDDDTWGVPSQWKLSDLLESDGGYLSTNGGSRRSFGDVDESVEIGSDGIGRILEELPIRDDGGRRYDDVSQYAGPSDYTGEPSLYRTSPLVKSLLALKRREGIIAMLENRIRNAEFDEE